MESKKINQLATSVSPQTSDLTIIGDPVTGVSKKITLLQIANLFATTGTVSSVAVTETGDALTITGSPITTAGTINIGFAGDATQYVRGDGALADFPTSTGGGSSVSYYLNSSVSQGTIGGVAYRELSKDPISGAGTDITISANGYVASYITDANDPSLLEVPGGNFNCEFYFSVNSNAHNPYVYAELYKYDGTTFTLLGSSQSVPEYLTNGTTLSPYYFAIPVATAALSVTDRLAIRIYVNVDGRVVTLHTENNHLCQVVTTFSKGLISLNNLTRQNQFFATGTSGTDFNISSATATHTFNIPVASAANTGKLSSTDWSTFNGKVPYTGATANVDLGDNDLIAQGVSGIVLEARVSGLSSSPLVLRTGTTGIAYGTNAISLISSSTTANTLIITSDIASVTKTAQIGLGSLTASRTFTLPDITGTLALLEGSQTFSGAKTFSDNTIFSASPLFDQSANYKVGASLAGTGNYISMAFDKSGTGSGSTLSMKLADGTSVKSIILDFVGSPATYTYTFPAVSGTIALTSNLSSYVPYSGATGAVDLGTNSFTAGSSITINGVGSTGGPLVFKQLSATSTNGGPSTTGISALGSTQLFISYSDSSSNYRNIVFDSNLISNNSIRYFSFPNASGTLALTSDLGSYLPLAGGTLTGALSGTSATFSGSLGVNSTIRSTGQTDPASGVGMELFYRSADTSSYIQSYDRTNSAWKDVRIYGNTLYFGSQGSNNLTIASTGAATFSSSVTATSGIFTVNDAATNSVLDILTLTHTTSGTAASGLGAGILFRAERPSGGITLSRGAIYGVSGTDADDNGDLAFYTLTNTGASGFSEKMRIKGSGNVGIGTSSPTEKLDVIGGGLAAGNGTIRTGITYGTFGLIGTFTNHDLGIITNGTERMRITSAGNLAIGTGVASVKLTVSNAANGDIAAFTNTVDADFYINLTSGVARLASGTNILALGSNNTERMRITSSGVTISNLAGTGSRAVLADASGNLSAPVSDISVKENITSIGYGLSEILKMNPVWYNFIDDYKNYGEGRQNGNIAQEMQKIIPEAVFVTPSTGKMGINYEQMHGVYIKAIQELEARIKQLENK